MLVSSAANVNVHDNVLAWNDAGIAVWSNDRPDRPSSGTVGLSVHNNTVIMRDPGAVSLEWTQYGSGKLFDSGRGKLRLEQWVLVPAGRKWAAAIFLARQTRGARRLQHDSWRSRRLLPVERCTRRGAQGQRRAVLPLTHTLDSELCQHHNEYGNQQNRKHVIGAHLVARCREQ